LDSNYFRIKNTLEPRISYRAQRVGLWYILCETCVRLFRASKTHSPRCLSVFFGCFPFPPRKAYPSTKRGPPSYPFTSDSEAFEVRFCPSKLMHLFLSYPCTSSFENAFPFLIILISCRCSAPHLWGRELAVRANSFSPVPLCWLPLRFSTPPIFARSLSSLSSPCILNPMYGRGVGNVLTFNSPSFPRHLKTLSQIQKISIRDG